MATEVTTLKFDDGVDEWTLAYATGSSVTTLTGILKIDFQGHGVMVETETQRRLFPWANVVYILQSI